MIGFSLFDSFLSVLSVKRDPGLLPAGVKTRSPAAIPSFPFPGRQVACQAMEGELLLQPPGRFKTLRQQAAMQPVNTSPLPAVAMPGLPVG